MAPISLIKQVGYFNNDVHAVDDYHLYLWLSQLGPIIRIKLPLTYYYFHDNNLSMIDTVIFKGLSGMAKILEEQEAPRFWVRMITAQSLKSEGVYMLRKDPNKALANITKSLRAHFRLRSFAIWLVALKMVLTPSRFRKFQA